MKGNWVSLLILFVFFSCEKNNVSDSTTLFLNNVSSGSVETVSTIGGSLNEVANSVFATNDGGYIVAGYTQSNDGDIEGKTDTSFDFWVLKFDEDNAVEWKKTYGGSNDDRANKVIQTSDGNFVIIGYSNSNDGDITINNGLRDFWIVKLDMQGTVLWEKSYGFAGNDVGINIKETARGDLIAVGELDVTASGGQGNSGKFQTNHAGGDYWVLKLNSSGNLIWSRFFGGSFTDTAFDINFDSSNNLYIIGSSDSNDSDITNNKGSYDFWVVKVDDNGTLIWEKSFGGSEIDQGRAIIKTNTGFLLVGDTRSSNVDVSNNNGGADIWTANIDFDGSLLSNLSYGGSSFDLPKSAFKTLDNGVIITGNSRSSDLDLSNNNGQNDVWVFKLDANNSIVWQSSVGGSNIDIAHQVTQLNNGTIIVVGESDSSDGDIVQNKGFADALIITIK